MKFIIELWPDLDDTTDPREALRWALESIRRGGEALSWDVQTDDGRMHRDIILESLTTRTDTP